MSASVKLEYGEVPRLLMQDATSPHLVTQARQAAIDAAGPLVQRHLTTNTPSGATGKARQMVTFERSVLGQPVGFVGYGAPASLYIGFVNDGTRPHWPPIEALAFYAARKFGLTVGSAEARSAGYRMARAISRRGTKAQKFVERTRDQVEGQAQALMTNAVLRVFGR